MLKSLRAPTSAPKLVLTLYTKHTIVNKQLQDKERLEAALDNESILTFIHSMISEEDKPVSLFDRNM